MEYPMSQDVLRVVLSYMEELDCPRSLTVAILVRNSEWDQLTLLELDPAFYPSAETYYRACCATELLRKFQGFPLDVNLEEETKRKWLDSEAECLKTNLRLDSLLSGGLPANASDHAVLQFLLTAKRLVREWLGACPEVVDGVFGPGATVSDTSRRCTVPDKMSSTPTYTPNSVFHLVPWSGTWWAHSCAELGTSPASSRGNHYFTVVKNSRALRSCAKEPSINSFYQLGLGRALRRKLAAIGIDLTHGQEVHRKIACTGSADDSFASIDLKSASDTLATGLVSWLLPPSWFHPLNDLRSPFTRVDGSWYKLEKFSSMGNGFTFELETLCFLAICVAASRCELVPGVTVFVYGDDILVPTEYSEVTIAALKWCGFTPNPKKTFVKGPFRESCGGDYYDGMPVRAHYLKESPNDPQSLITLANGIRRVHTNLQGLSPGCTGLVRTWFRCLDLIPSSVRSARGPCSLGDIVIHDDESRWSVRWRSSIRYVKCFRPARFKKVRWEGFAYDVQMAAALYGVTLMPEPRVGSGAPKERIRYLIPRDGVTGYKVGWVPFS